MGSGSSKKSSKGQRPAPNVTSTTDAAESAPGGSATQDDAGQKTSAVESTIDDQKSENKIDGGATKTIAGAIASDEMGDVVETVLCLESDLKNGEMREFTVEEAKVLLVKDNDKFHAIGGKCTHYGAGLSKGAYSNGYVRCPWHGACFNVETGDIEDFPGLDSVPSYKVELVNGSVKLIASRQQLSESKRVKPMCRMDEKLASERVVVIVGGGGSAAACAESLRQNNFAGRIILISQEPCLPYDRPKLSKALDAKVETLQLRTKEFYDNNRIELRLGQPVATINFAKKAVLLADESMVGYNYLVLATGGKPRTLRCPGAELKNVFHLRSPSDGKAIADVTVGKHVVVVGSSFIGMEVACWAIGKKAASVTVVCQSQMPYVRVFGAEIGAAIKRYMFEGHGVKFELSVEIEKLVGDDSRHLKGVVLKNGKTVPADLLIAGIGVEPSTAFIKNSPIRMSERGYIQVNSHMQTSDPAVYACGDIVDFPLSSFGDQLVNVQHWQMALKHGKTAGQAIAGRPEAIKTVPYFWTVLFGKSIRYTGYSVGYDKLIIRGQVDEMKFVAYFLKQDKLVAVATVGRDPIASQIAECFRNGKSITAADVDRNTEDEWTNLL